MPQMLIGYARVSTQEQNLDLQKDDLKQAGCKRIFTDVASGSRAERPGLNQAVAYAREGDTLVVWKLDRFGRSLAHLIEGVRQLQARGIGFRSLRENIDTTSSAGKLIFHLFGALAEFERDLIGERTAAGLSSARARGRLGGRRPLLDSKQVTLLRSLAADRANSPGVICETLGISRATFYRYLATRAGKIGAANGHPARHPRGGATRSVSRQHSRRRGDGQ
jgi:DNA invertase Pin-like site-specific DNA recombinase